MVAAGVTHFDKAQWQPGAAFRCMFGVAVPVLAADITHHSAWGALAGLGALYAGFGSYRGVYRQRVRAILITVVIATFMTLLGCLTSQSSLAILTVVPICAFIAALYATSSQLANSVATQAVCVLVVLSGLGLGPSSAMGNAGLVLAGGLIQLFLLTVVWPVNPRYPERKAVSDAYVTLAEFFERVPNGVDELIPGTQRFEDARSILQEARDIKWRTEHEILVELMRSGETLRASAVGFAQACEKMQGHDCEQAQALCDNLSRTIKFIAARILNGQFKELEFSQDRLPAELIDNPELAHWYDLLRDRIADLNHVAPHMLDDPLNPPQEGVGWKKLFSFLTRLPDAKSLRNVAFSHAIRYTMTLEVALLVTQVWHDSHLYWLPLTVAICLRADFATTATRGAARLLGTLVGVTIATLVLSIFHPAGYLLSAMILIVTWFCFALLQPNYALYSVAITLYVVFSVASAALGHHGLAYLRLVATLGGWLLSVAAYVLWPAFQGRQMTEVLIEALTAQIDFGEKVKANPDDAKAIDDMRNHARQHRIRAENLFQTAALEPWGVSGQELAQARESILVLDENAAELLASRADRARESAEIDRVLKSSRELRDRLEAGGASSRASSGRLGKRLKP